MNFDRLRFVAERAELGEQREAMLAVTIPERPGSFREFCELLGKRSRHRIQLPLRRSARRARVRRRRGRESPRDRAAARGAAHARASRRYDLTDNEMAKLHVRHMVGGHAPAAEQRDPVPLRVSRAARRADEVPRQHERGWNISLFHYRNHGADYGRVLVGMQVPPRTSAEFRRFLDRLGYDYVDEIGESGLPDVSRPLTTTRGRWAAPRAAKRHIPVDRKLPECCVFVLFDASQPIPARFML